jgi:hypothetical protein
MSLYKTYYNNKNKAEDIVMESSVYGNTTQIQ